MYLYNETTYHIIWFQLIKYVLLGIVYQSKMRERTKVVANMYGRIFLQFVHNES